ncbi:IS1595 family transposase [Rathayibacter soli]|uniref:IS1595 family transposase n=1 Tax=Rathayibacter soli TaxID=3144168 RepID=UPI0039080763
MPSRGLQYPGSYSELRAWFPDDESCMDYLDWLRWPSGRVCPACGREATSAARGRVWRCGGCRKRVSRTAGTVFQDTRTPLTVWFAAAWYMTADPGGESALTMQRLLGLGSYQTAWAMLHRYRSAMVRPGRELLSGRVEVDETFLGGERPGPRGRGALGKTMVVIAVELHDPRGYGRARMSIIPNSSAKTLRRFLTATIEPGSTVVTDGWSAYRKACLDWYVHEPLPVSGHEAHELLPAMHRVAALCKRWLLGTHQGGVDADHLQSYLDEFCFRFNRRHSRARGLLFYRLLQYAAAAPPLTYRQLVADPQPKAVKPTGVNGPRSRPASLAQPPQDRPWRATTSLE